MKKLYLKRILATHLILLVLLLMFTPTAMAFNSADVKEIFPEEQVEQLIERINSQVISRDKQPLISSRSRDFSISMRSGDDNYGVYPTRPGVILVTPDKFMDFIPLGHSAIIRTSSTVVEATARGVVTGPNDWYRTRNRCYAVTVIETSPEQDLAASAWCYKQRRKPYNFNYFNIWTRRRFYCSQLVWAAFLDQYGINLDTPAFGHAIHPIELVTSPKTELIYVKE